MDGRAGVNAMIIPTMKYLGLRINRPDSITLKIGNK